LEVTAGNQSAFVGCTKSDKKICTKEVIIPEYVLKDKIFPFLDSPKFWENLTHPLMTGIQSDVDEVSVVILLIYRKEGKRCFGSKFF